MRPAPAAALARRRGLLPMPSIWPLIRRARPPSVATSKIWNLTLEDPALTTRTVFIVSRCRHSRDATARVGVEHGDGARGHAGAHRIRARGEHDRHPRAEHDA